MFDRNLHRLSKLSPSSPTSPTSPTSDSMESIGTALKSSSIGSVEMFSSISSSSNTSVCSSKSSNALLDGHDTSIFWWMPLILSQNWLNWLNVCQHFIQISSKAYSLSWNFKLFFKYSSQFESDLLRTPFKTNYLLEKRIDKNGQQTLEFPNWNYTSFDNSFQSTIGKRPHSFSRWYWSDGDWIFSFEYKSTVLNYMLGLDKMHTECVIIFDSNV